jgi:hypothetical protein
MKRYLLFFLVLLACSKTNPISNDSMDFKIQGYWLVSFEDPDTQTQLEQYFISYDTLKRRILSSYDIYDTTCYFITLKNQTVLKGYDIKNDTRKIEFNLIDKDNMIMYLSSIYNGKYNKSKYFCKKS